MTVDPAVVPGFLLLLAELAVLAAVGFIVARVVLRQADDRLALAQGLVVGPALWGLITNFVLYAVPGLAGAAVGWGVTLSLGVILAWRGRPAWPRARLAAGFAALVLALSWVALASHQLVSVADPALHLGMAAAFRAGGFPPELSWSPGAPLRYHHGVDLLIGLLAPPFGPDLAFVKELLGVYAWTSLAVLVVAMLLVRSSWRVALLLAPLLLSPGLWTGTSLGSGILHGPIPAGLPEAGLRASLAEVFWPTAGQSLIWDTALPNLRNPQYPLAYALTLVVLACAAKGAGRSWPATVALAGLVGWIGLLATSLTPLVLALWAGVEALPLLGQVRRTRALTWRAVLRPVAGLALAVVLLLAGGGRFTGMLQGSLSSGLVLWWEGNPQSWRLLGAFDARPGGVGLVTIGPVVGAALAALLVWRDRLVTALAVGAGLLGLAWLVLRYELHPFDINRLAGHAFNFALLALVLAASVRLARLRPRWRYAASALLAGLVIWPTSVEPVRNLGMALAQGIEVANAEWAPPSAGESVALRRTALPPVSARVAAYIRDHTEVDARVFVPGQFVWKITSATGRPNSAGFPNLRHQQFVFGPEYLDVRNHLEPGAARRLGFDYLYATDEWSASLPARARHWLADPALFELLVRDGAEALYRVTPAFLALDVPPTPASFEALRRTVPAGAKVYWPSGAPFETDTTMRVASVLAPEAQLFGVLKYALRRLHALTPVPVESLGEQTPDLVIVPVGLDPWMFPPDGRQPVWWHESMAIYVPHGTVAPIMPPPDAWRPHEPPPISVRASDVRVADGRMSFTLTVDDHSPDRWSGQDWMLISVDRSPWAIPRHLETDQRTPVVEQWFAGQVVRGRGTTTHGYVFDAVASSLHVRTGDGGFRTEASSAGMIGPGSWTLALRLRQEVDRGTYLAHEEAAFIPVLKVTMTEDGAVVYEVYDDLRSP